MTTKRDGAWTDCAPFAYWDHKILNNSEITIQGGRGDEQKVKSPRLTKWSQILALWLLVIYFFENNKGLQSFNLNKVFYLYSFITFVLLRRPGRTPPLPFHRVLTYSAPSYTCPIKSFVFFLLSQYDTVYLHLYFPPWEKSVCQCYMYLTSCFTHTHLQSTIKTKVPTRSHIIVFCSSDKIIQPEDNVPNKITIFTWHTM